LPSACGCFQLAPQRTCTSNPGSMPGTPRPPAPTAKSFPRSKAYDQSAIEGQRRLSSKHTDCAAAVRDLADLERAVTGASPVQARTATVASPPSAGATTGALDAEPQTNQRSAAATASGPSFYQRSMMLQSCTWQSWMCWLNAQQSRIWLSTILGSGSWIMN
jgi:hypothetical protein